MICPNCNKQIPDDSDICQYCNNILNLNIDPFAIDNSSKETVAMFDPKVPRKGSGYEDMPADAPAYGEQGAQPPIAPQTPQSSNQVPSSGFAQPPQGGMPANSYPNQGAPADVNSLPSQKPKRNTGLIIGAVAAVVIVAIIGIVVVFLSTRGSSTEPSYDIVEDNSARSINTYADVDINSEVASDNIIDSLAPDQRKLANQFISNFAEVGFGNFNSNGNMEEYKNQIINFSMTRCFVNNRQGIKIDGGGTATLSEKVIKDDAARFFNYNLTSHGNTDFVKYHSKSKAYTATVDDITGKIPEGYIVDFGSYSNVASISEMYRLDNDNYIVNFDVYLSNMGPLTKDYYSKPAEYFSSSSDFSLVARGTAEIRDYYIGSENKYQLVQYAVRKLEQ